MIPLIDLGALTGQYAGRLINVAGVFHAVLPSGRSFHPYTAKRPTPSAGYVFVLKGSGTFTLDGTDYELHAGSVVHGGPRMTVSMHTRQSELEYMLVRYRLDPPAAADPRPHGGYADSHYMLEPGVNRKLADLLSQLYESFYTPGSMALIRTGYLFDIVLYELFAACLNRQNGDGKEKIEQAKAYIHHHYMEPLSLHMLAERHGMGAKSFSYLFHKHTGISPIDYLIQYRMKRAQELLTIGSCTIKQVAASVGYEDALYFSRLYKKHIGLSPSKSQPK